MHSSLHSTPCCLSLEKKHKTFTWAQRISLNASVRTQSLGLKLHSVDELRVSQGPQMMHHRRPRFHRACLLLFFLVVPITKGSSVPAPVRIQATWVDTKMWRLFEYWPLIIQTINTRSSCHFILTCYSSSHANLTWQICSKENYRCVCVWWEHPQIPQFHIFSSCRS